MEDVDVNEKRFTLIVVTSSRVKASNGFTKHIGLVTLSFLFSSFDYNTHTSIHLHWLLYLKWLVWKVTGCSLKTRWLDMNGFPCSNVVHTKLKVVVTNPPMITHAQLRFELNILAWHESMYDLLIVSFHKQFRSRYYKMKLCPKAHTNIYET